MSTILRAVTDEVRPEHGLFVVAGVVDGIMTGSAVDGRMEPPGGRVAAGHDGLIIQAAHLYESCRVHGRLERWDGPPPMDTWEELWTGRLRLESGLVGVEAWADYYSHDFEFDLGQADTTWSVRVVTKILQTEREAGFPDAAAQVELYKIQFWT
ncbi:hypothetical protein AB0O28_19700 [Microbispora sp. NPDC088329]|uniref:hypothetical protein n=1 Tax=Microbispora sp. NPDC088329 TaxID=3154869 RepID=UPI00341894D0